MSATSGDTPHHGITRLAVSMLILAAGTATVLSCLTLATPGISLLTRRGDAVPSTSSTSNSIPITRALIQQGAALVGLQCAGCHEREHRLVGPSWIAIGQRYARMAKLDAICGDGRGLIAAGAAHPAPGWDDYPPGPASLELSPLDRAAIAAWVLDLARGETK